MNETIMRSKKISKNKQMIILWISLAVLLVVSVVVMAVKYSPIKKAQDIVISGMLAFTDDYDEYKNSRGKMLQELEENFTMGYLSGLGSEMHNAQVDVYDAQEDLANELLETAGYGNHIVLTWLSYGTFSQYYFGEGLPFVIVLVILAAVIGVASALYLMDKKTELIIQKNAIIGKMSNGKTVQFLLRDIKSVETTKTQGLKITGAGIKYEIHLIENGEELKSTIMGMLANVSKEKTVVATAPVSDAKSIKEYKELLDSGIITQEEFEAKKKQLLGL